MGYFLSPSGLPKGHTAVAQRVTQIPESLDDVGHAKGAAKDGTDGTDKTVRSGSNRQQANLIQRGIGIN